MKFQTGFGSLFSFVFLMLAACGQASHEQLDNRSVLNLANGSTIGLTGQQIFQQRCANCHGSIAAFGPRTPAQITTAFASFPQMSGVAAITNAEEIQAISDALNGITTVVDGSPAGSMPLTGAQLYMVNCQGCHALTPPGGSRTAGGILSAINGVNEMAALSSLSASERQAIAEYVSANLQIGEVEDD